MKDRLSIAYHEAGHALVMRHYKVPFRYISMKPRADGISAHVMHDGREKVKATAFLDIHAAGMVAQKIQNPTLDLDQLIISDGSADVAKMFGAWVEAGYIRIEEGEPVGQVPEQMQWNTVVERTFWILNRYLAELSTVAWELAGRTRALTHREFLAIVGGVA